MRQWNDAELLSAYANRQSEEAFGVLVERYVALVYSAALRQVQNPHLAEEVTQAAFTILAQKARRLNGRTVLSGWLCRTAHFVARNALKTEFRRQYRETEAHMQSLNDEPEAEIWQRFAPLLDEAVAQLNEADRNAVVLRFYEKKPLNEVGAILGIDADAAQKRVSRALEKLRKFFAKRGVDSTTAAIAENISAHSIQAAPVALAKSVTAVAMVKGSIASVSTITLVKGTLKIMTYAKLKQAIGITAGILLVGGAVTLAISQTSGGNQLSAQEIAKQSLDTYASLSSYSDTGKTIVEMGNIKTSSTFDIRLGRSGLYRVEWAQMTAGRTVKGAAWFAGDGDFLQIEGPGSSKYSKMQTRQETLNAASGLSGMIAQSIPALFFNESGSNFLSASFSKQNDEKIGDTDCYV